MEDRKIYCSVTYLFWYSPSELGLPGDASVEELEAAVHAAVDEFIDGTWERTGIDPNDVEIEVV